MGYRAWSTWIVACPWHDVIVRVLVLRVHFRSSRKLTWLPAGLLTVNEHMLDLCRDALGIVSRRVVSLPRYVCDEARRGEDLVANEPQVRELRVVDADEDGTRRSEQLPQKLEPWVHHAQPLVVAGEILTLLTDDVANPLADTRIVDVVVVFPVLVAGVVWRIDVDAVDPALVLGQQRLQRLEVVAVDDHVPAVRAAAVEHALLGHALEHAIRDVTVVVDHLLLAHPIESRH